MRTNIEINEKLINEVMKKAHLKTKKAAVNTALNELLNKLAKKELASMFGKVKWEGSLEKMRTSAYD